MIKRKCEHCGTTRNILYSEELDVSLCKKCVEGEVYSLQAEAQNLEYEVDVWEDLLKTRDKK